MEVLLVMCLTIFYLFLIMPNTKKTKSFDELKGPYFAHRGLHGKKSTIPENSMSAFQRAVDAGYGIELDVQLTRDGIPVVFHDYSLKRVCGLEELLCNLTCEELRSLRLFDSNEGIPKLQEVLDLVDGKVPLLIEFKTEEKDMKICEVVMPFLDEYQGQYCIESFNPLVLNWFRKYRPEIIRGQLATNFFHDPEYRGKLLYFALGNLLLNILGRPDFIAYEYKYRKKLSFLLCKKLFNVKTFAWTISSIEEVEEGRKLFDYFIFESFNP